MYANERFRRVKGDWDKASPKSGSNKNSPLGTIRLKRIDSVVGD